MTAPVAFVLLVPEESQYICSFCDGLHEWCTGAALPFYLVYTRLDLSPEQFSCQLDPSTADDIINLPDGHVHAVAERESKFRGGQLYCSLFITSCYAHIVTVTTYYCPSN
jgi:hypothetical protein